MAVRPSMVTSASPFRFAFERMFSKKPNSPELALSVPISPKALRCKFDREVIASFSSADAPAGSGRGEQITIREPREHPPGVVGPIALVYVKRFTNVEERRSLKSLHRRGSWCRVRALARHGVG